MSSRAGMADELAYRTSIAMQFDARIHTRPVRTQALRIDVPRWWCYFTECDEPEGPSPDGPEPAMKRSCIPACPP